MNVLKLQKKFPQISQGDIFSLADAFRKLDVDDKGYIDEATAIRGAQQSEQKEYDVVRQALKEVGLDSSRRVELEDYVGLVAKLRDESAESVERRQSIRQTPFPISQGRVSGHASKSSITHIQGSGNTTHSVANEERAQFASHIQAVLAGDPDVDSRLNFDVNTFEVIDQCKDGLLLAKLINNTVPDTIDERVLNIPGRKIKSLNTFHMTENNNIVIESAKGIGCSVVNIGSQDIIEGRDHLVLGLIWQIIRRGLLSKVDIKLHPELYRLLEEDEELESFLRLTPEKILLRWFNFHLKAAGWDRRVDNFSEDVKDGTNYTILLSQIGREHGCTRAPLQAKDNRERAEQVLANAAKLGCRKFLTPSTLENGNPKLNLAFVANLFNSHPCLDAITEEEKVKIDEIDDGSEGMREARVYTLWLNSLDVKPPVVSLFHDLRDGIVLLQAVDTIIKGSVNWRHVTRTKVNSFSAPGNIDYALELGRQNGCSLGGIDGKNIAEGDRGFTLSVMWQLMRKNINITLSDLAQRLGKREISDQEMVRWANSMCKKGGKTSTVNSLNDPSIGKGIFLIDVLHGMKSSYVDYGLVESVPSNSKSDEAHEKAYMNAKLSISIARKMGAAIWLLPEDIVQVRSKLITFFVGSLMATSEKL